MPKQHAPACRLRAFHTRSRSLSSPSDVTSAGLNATHHIFLVPGMFGFSRLAGYDYFSHVEKALHERFSAAGELCHIEVVSSAPTGSIRKRARVLAETVQHRCADTTGPIHLIGHSTGGLDTRLLASPTVNLDTKPDSLPWIGRLQTVVTINTPHYGTPLAQFFTTVAGTRLLSALSLLTFATLHLGGPPLTVFASLVAAVGRIDEALGIELHLLDRSTDLMLRFLGEDSRIQVRDWLDGIRKDQGGVIQITPEAMDIFNAAAEDSPAVRYGCIASAAPSPHPVRLASKLLSPYSALSATLYSTLYAITSSASSTYPCPPPAPDVVRRLQAAVGETIGPRLNDGIVPTQSMLWGELLWAARADHLDVVGHFADTRDSPHTDWLHSGAGFSRAQFGQSMRAISDFLLRA